MIVIISDPLYTYACLFEIELMCISLLIAYTFHLISCLLSASLAKEGRIYESTLLCIIFYTRVPQQNIMQSKTQCRNDVQNWAQPHFDCRCMYGQDRECNHAIYNGDCGWRRNNPRERERCGVHLLLSIVYCFKTMPKFSGNISTFPNSDVHEHTCRKE